jgi:hypothetical protein
VFHNCRLLPESQKRRTTGAPGAVSRPRYHPLEALWEIGRVCRLESSRAGARLSFEPHNIALQALGQFRGSVGDANSP